MSITFSAEGIRRMSAMHRARQEQAVTTARQQIQGISITLPKCLHLQQGQLSQVLGWLPASIQVLTEMASSFQEKAYQTAAAYERAESQNTEQAQLGRST